MISNIHFAYKSKNNNCMQKMHFMSEYCVKYEEKAKIDIYNKEIATVGNQNHQATAYDHTTYLCNISTIDISACLINVQNKYLQF